MFFAYSCKAVDNSLQNLLVPIQQRPKNICNWQEGKVFQNTLSSFSENA